jgi:ATP-dependent DNA ligase
VRLITRGGYDWMKRYAWIVEASLENRIKHFVLGGEAVVPGVDGISDFNAPVKSRRGVFSQAPLVGTSPAASGNW